MKEDFKSLWTVGWKPFFWSFWLSYTYWRQFSLFVQLPLLLFPNKCFNKIPSFYHLSSPPYYCKCPYSQGVESDRCPSFSKALAAGKPTAVTIQSTLADGLAVPLVGYNAFHTAQPLIDKMVVFYFRLVFSWIFLKNPSQTLTLLVG